MKTLILSLALAATGLAAEKLPILLVLTNHSELGDSGKKTGFYLSEAAHPYKVFSANAYEVTLASPEGGFAPIDPKSLDLEDTANLFFFEKYGNADTESPGVDTTEKLADIDATKYSAIFFAGGHGSMWDFPDSKSLQKLTAAIYENGGAVGAVCHGPAALVNVKLSDGTLLIAGKKTAVFTNSEEEAVKLTDTVPFLLETVFKEGGATVKTAENFTVNAIRDGRLVTGQNPPSAEKSGKLLIEAIEEK